MAGGGGQVFFVGRTVSVASLYCFAVSSKRVIGRPRETPPSICIWGDLDDPNARMALEGVLWSWCTRNFLLQLEVHSVKGGACNPET